MIEDRSFLNQEENLKVKAIIDYLNNFQEKNYDNRFNKFSEKIEIIGWEEIIEWINILAEKIKDKHYVGIFGVPRGGLILAVLLSYKTGLPLLQNPCKNCIIMDDDMSTGITLLPYVNRYDIALMYKNPKCKIEPTYLFREYGKIFKKFIWNV